MKTTINKTHIEYEKDDNWILLSNDLGDGIEIYLDDLDKIIEILNQAKKDMVYYNDETIKHLEGDNKCL